MKIFTITTLYPNQEDLKHGIFVENRLRHLLAYSKTTSATVIAPVPWFPIKISWLPEYSKYVDVKYCEHRHGIDVYHPRYLVIPKLGMLLTPLFLALSMIMCVRSIIKNTGRPDLIDGHYFYPDGVAIALLCRWMKIPFTCTSRGTDLNLIADLPLPRKMIAWTINQASRSMAVCQALSDKLTELGAKSPVTLRNGVDLAFFQPLSSSQIKAQRKLTIKPEYIDHNVLLSVGWLVERKGHYLAIESLVSLPQCILFIAGNGPDGRALKKLAEDLNVAQRVFFLGSLDQQTLKAYYQISDALILGSSREGWANVLLESMACGTPVVASKIWGTPEVVKTPAAGLLVERNVSGIAAGVSQLLANYPDRVDTRIYAEQFDWDETSLGQLNIFNHIVEQAK